MALEKPSFLKVVGEFISGLLLLASFPQYLTPPRALPAACEPPSVSCTGRLLLASLPQHPAPGYCCLRASLRWRKNWAHKWLNNLFLKPWCPDLTQLTGNKYYFGAQIQPSWLVTSTTLVPRSKRKLRMHHNALKIGNTWSKVCELVFGAPTPNRYIYMWVWYKQKFRTPKTE